MQYYFLLIPIFLFALFLLRGRKAPRAEVAEIDLRWEELSFFERHGSGFAENRLDLALRLGCGKLGTANALLLIHSEGACRVKKIFSPGDKPNLFQEEQELPRSLVYCGMLNNDRKTIAIDYAGLSEWRRHRAHEELGWESYIGAWRQLTSGEGLTVAFYHHQPRDKLFSVAEKRLVEQLSNWIAAIFERERQIQMSEGNEHRETQVRV